MSDEWRDLLQRAAATIREVADAATPGPWAVEGQGSGVESRNMGCGVVYTMGGSVMGGDIAEPAGDCYPRGDYSPMGDMSHIAFWDPVVALAVADWLEVTARDVGTSTFAFHAARDFARLLLGEDA